MWTILVLLLQTRGLHASNKPLRDLSVRTPPECEFRKEEYYYRRSEIDEACNRAEEEMTQQARASVEGMDIVGKRMRIEDCERFDVPGFCAEMERLRGDNGVCCAPCRNMRATRSLCKSYGIC